MYPRIIFNSLFVPVGLAFHYFLRPEDQGEHECAALDHSAMFRWRDIHCNEARLAHICDYGTFNSVLVSLYIPQMYSFHLFLTEFGEVSQRFTE